MIMLKQVLIVTIYTVVVMGSPIIGKDLDEAWNLWKQKFSKNYSTEDEKFRRQIWEDNMQLVSKHNEEHSLGLHSYTLGMNEYAHMTDEEFASVMTAYRHEVINEQKGRNFSDIFGTPPKRIDWRDHGYVTKVKNQGQCGSYWAFAATGSLEGQHFRRTGQLVSLSEQNLLDCSKSSYGCNGGLPTDAFHYVIENRGIATEWSYPYDGQQRICRFNRYNIGATLYSSVELLRGSEATLEQAVGSIGPVSVCIDASQRTFHLYKSGIYHDKSCMSSNFNHAVLVVGYDTDPSGVEYWIVKNSWGTSWGQEGYIWMSKNKDNQCGIATKASYPLV